MWKRIRVRLSTAQSCSIWCAGFWFNSEEPRKGSQAQALQVASSDPYGYTQCVLRPRVAFHIWKNNNNNDTLRCELTELLLLAHRKSHVMCSSDTLKWEKERAARIHRSLLLGSCSEIETEHGEKKVNCVWKMIYFVRVIIFDDGERRKRTHRGYEER